MTIVISIISLLIVAVIVSVVFGMKRGYRIAEHLHMFDLLYDNILSQTNSKEIALESGLVQFKLCPRYSKLTDDDIKLIVSNLAPLPDPKKIFNKIVLQMDSKKAVMALKDENFLNEIVKIYNKPKLDSSVETDRSSLQNKAEDLVDACRTLIGVIQPTLYRNYPELLTLPDDTRVTYFGTIACVWTACVRLHFDVPKEDRTPLELIVQEQLLYWHPEALQEYKNINSFVSHYLLSEPDRAKRGNFLFDLAGIWVVAKITNEEEVKGKGLEIANTFSDFFIQETSGYWK